MLSHLWGLCRCKGKQLTKGMYGHHHHRTEEPRKAHQGLHLLHCPAPSPHLTQHPSPGWWLLLLRMNYELSTWTPRAAPPAWQEVGWQGLRKEEIVWSGLGGKGGLKGVGEGVKGEAASWVPRTLAQPI